MQLMLGTMKICDDLEVRHHINIQQKRQEHAQVQSIWQELLYLINRESENNTETDDN